jgi:hypothetical protein
MSKYIHFFDMFKEHVDESDIFRKCVGIMVISESKTLHIIGQFIIDMTVD